MRVFKTKGFTTAAKKADIPDVERCKAMQEVVKGQDQGTDVVGQGSLTWPFNRQAADSYLTFS